MNAVQLDLSEPSQTKESITNKQLHVSRSTFKGGLAEAVHRWFRLTPSFGPELVRNALSDMKTPIGSNILDPFTGAGTTLIECQMEGYDAFGFEINPFLHFVASASLNWTLETENLYSILERIRDLFNSTATDNATWIDPSSLQQPPIHNIERWWRSDVLTELLKLLAAIELATDLDIYKHFFQLGLAGVLIPALTNVTLGRLQLHFIDRSKDAIDVWSTFDTHISCMIQDMKQLSHKAKPNSATVYHTDATEPSKIGNIPLIDRVVTSPPYPNRYSYVWNTRPYLYLFGFFTKASQSSSLDSTTIGGTWGTATSRLAKGVIDAEFDIVQEVVKPITDKIRVEDNLMANYVMKYFNDIAKQVTAQDKFLADGAQLAYVVGCSRIKGVYIESDVLLAKLMCGLGLNYKLNHINRFRRRNSDKDLYESTVYIIRN